MEQPYIDPVVAQQDQLRPLRQFISLASGLAGDQSYSGTDFSAVNPSGQFESYGPHGIAVEGQPVLTYAPNAGLTIAPMLIMLGIGVAAFLLLR